MRRRHLLRCAAVLMLIAVFGFSISQATSLPGGVNAETAKQRLASVTDDAVTSPGELPIEVGPSEEIALKLQQVERFVQRERGVADEPIDGKPTEFASQTASPIDDELFAKTAFDEQQISQFHRDLKWRLSAPQKYSIDPKTCRYPDSPSDKLLRSDVADRLEGLANELDAANLSEKATTLRSLCEDLRTEKRVEDWKAHPHPQIFSFSFGLGR